MDPLRAPSVGGELVGDKMWDKFEDCAGRALPGERLLEVFDMLDGLESVGDVNELTRLLQPTAG